MNQSSNVVTLPTRRRSEGWTQGYWYILLSLDFSDRRIILLSTNSLTFRQSRSMFPELRQIPFQIPLENSTAVAVGRFAFFSALRAKVEITVCGDFTVFS